MERIEVVSYVAEVKSNQPIGGSRRSNARVENNMRKIVAGKSPMTWMKQTISACRRTIRWMPDVLIQYCFKVHRQMKTVKHNVHILTIVDNTQQMPSVLFAMTLHVMLAGTVENHYVARLNSAKRERRRRWKKFEAYHWMMLKKRTMPQWNNLLPTSRRRERRRRSCKAIMTPVMERVRIST